MVATTHDLNELKRRMQGAINLLKQELSGLRTGRASAAMLDPVQVEAYGTHMPLNQLATVSVPEPRLISVQVWDRSMVHPVEKAIINANLGLSPATEGQVLRLQAEAFAFVVSLSSLAARAIEIISRVELHARLSGPDLHRAPTTRLVDVRCEC